MSKRLFTSESVTEGHPDKICDQISDAVLDALLAADPNSRVACETTCTTGQILIMGEISTTANIDIPAIARQTVCEIGYDDAAKGFDGNTCAVLLAVDKQTPDHDRTGIGPVDARDAAEHRGFARAVRPDESVDRAVRHGEA